MARLYNGIDILGLGRAINDTHNNIHLNRVDPINQFANGLGSLIMGIHEKGVDDDARANALAAAQKAGLENADELSRSMSGADFAKYVMGYTDKLGDEGRAEKRTIDAENRAEERAIAGEERADLADIEKRNRDFADFIDRNAVTSEQALRNSVLGQLFGNLGNVTVKDYGNSKQGKIDRENAVNAIVDFFNDDEKMQGTIRQLLTKGMSPESGSEPWWDEDQLEEANSIINSGSKTMGKDVEGFIEKLEKNNMLEQFQNKNPGTWREMMRKADKSTQQRYIRSGDAGKGVTSNKEREDEIRAKEEAKALKNDIAALNKAYDGGEIPTLSEARKKQLWNMVGDDKKSYPYRAALMQFYGYNGG